MGCREGAAIYEVRALYSAPLRRKVWFPPALSPPAVPNYWLLRYHARASIGVERDWPSYTRRIAHGYSTLQEAAARQGAGASVRYCTLRERGARVRQRRSRRSSR